MHGYKRPINCTRTRIAQPALLLRATCDGEGCTSAGLIVWISRCAPPRKGVFAAPLPRSCPGAWPYNRPCAQQYVGKSQSCMVISGRLIVHAPVQAAGLPQLLRDLRHGAQAHPSGEIVCPQYWDANPETRPGAAPHAGQGAAAYDASAPSDDICRTR